MENRIPRLGETPWLQSTSMIGPKQKLRRPPGLILDKSSKLATISLDTNSEASSSCGICSHDLTINPRLCSDCQIWNDAHHVFECLGEAATWEGRKFLTLQDVLSRTECLICKPVGRSVLKKLATSESHLKEELAKVEIMNCGPYCFGQDALDALNPELLRKHGRHQMSPDDLRLSDSQPDDNVTTPAADHLKVVIYLVLTATPGSMLHEQFPELDSYKTLDAKQIPVSEEGKFSLGIQRRVPYDGSVLLQPTVGLQLELCYARKKRVLLGVFPWEYTYIDTSLVSQWLQNCDAAHSSIINITHKPECSLGADQVPLPSGFKAIDTIRLCIVEIPSTPSPSYAALSYTWGATSGVKELQLELSNKKELYNEGSLRQRNGIPDIILDAITLCADLNVQYLWVDRLCIVQDDLVAKMDQINAMDRIYHMASFTIVAAVPLGIGLPGVRNRPRKSSLANYSRRFHPKLRFVTDNFRSTVMNSFWYKTDIPNTT